MYMTSTIDSGAAPARTARYKTVKEQIVKALSQGRWKRGQKIASEPQLAERHGVSVGTIRRAVGELVAENILTRTQGSGTYVVSHTPDYMLNAFFRIVDRDGHKELPTIDSFSMRSTRADASTAAALRLRPRASVIEIETLLSLQGRPTILDRMRLPPALFPDLTERVFASRDGTVYGLFQQRFGITVVRLEEFVTAVVSSARESRLLCVAKGAPLLQVQRTAYTYKDVPVDYRVRLIDSTRHGYLSVIGAG
jgi:GntR family transcriptional regulator